MTGVLSDLFLPLRERLTGSLVTSAGGGYWDVSRAAWVTADERPSAVVHAACDADVAAVVEFAHAHGLRVVARDAAARGHRAGTVVLDTSRLQGTTAGEVLGRGA
jgi:FAD/FMN-containing dehydrogenase